MTIEEMSNEFDNELFKLYETGVTPTPIQLNEYEKSVYLTKAQEAIVDNLYAEYDSTELVRRQLHNLVYVNSIDITNDIYKSDIMGYTQYRILCSTLYTASTSIKAILNEYVTLTTSCGDSMLYVTPVKQDELIKILGNPFRTANDNRALRIEDRYLNANTLKLICKSFEEVQNITYNVVYLRNPKPIILEDLRNITINDESKQSTSIDLSEDLHRKIIEIAVSMVLTGLNNKKSNKDT